MGTVSGATPQSTHVGRRGSGTKAGRAGGGCWWRGGRGGFCQHLSHSHAGHDVLHPL